MISKEQSSAGKKKLCSPALIDFLNAADQFITTSSESINRLYTPADWTEKDYEELLVILVNIPSPAVCIQLCTAPVSGPCGCLRVLVQQRKPTRRFKYLLEQGQTGLSVAFDMPTLMGFDTDAPEAEGEFGRCGVAISSLGDMEILLDGLPLDKISTSMTINSPAAVVWAMYIARG